MDEQKEKEIEAMIQDAELLDETKKKVESEIAAEEAEEEAKTSFWKTIRNAFCRTVKSIVVLACKLIKSEILFILNNENNQKLAKVAVITAMRLGLKSSAAWAAAWSILISGEIYISEHVVVNAKDVKKNILETLLQLVYCCIANKNDKSVLESCNR